MKMWTFTIVCMALWGLPGGAAEQQVRARVGNTQLPRVEYRDARVDDAFERLAEASREADPEAVGVNFVYRGPEGEQAPRVTLSLRRISLYDAIRYITQVAGLYYRIDDNAVIISDEPFAPDRIITRMYPVQPTFMDVIRSGREKEQQPRDPVFR